MFIIHLISYNLAKYTDSNMLSTYSMWTYSSFSVIFCCLNNLKVGVARYAYRTVRFTRQIPNGSDHPYPRVGTLEWTGHVWAIM